MRFILLLVFLVVHTVWADSDNFTLIAVGNDPDLEIQLYPLSIENGSVVLKKTTDELSFKITNEGKTEILNTDYRLILDDHSKLTANTTGTTIFYIAGKHLHYNEHYVFLACPLDSDNVTFSVYATSDSSKCSNGTFFSFRPQLNDTTAISSYIPAALSGSSSTADAGDTGDTTDTADATIAISTIGTTTTSIGAVLSTSTNTSNGGASSGLSTLAASDAVETMSMSTRVSTDADDNVTTVTVVVENTVESSTSTEPSATDDGDNDATTVTLTMSSSVSTHTSCLDSECETVYVSLYTLAASTLTTTQSAQATEETQEASATTTEASLVSSTAGETTTIDTNTGSILIPGLSSSSSKTQSGNVTNYLTRSSNVSSQSSLQLLKFLVTVSSIFFVL